MVFAALGDLMRTDIHALSLTALTPDEAAGGADPQAPGSRRGPVYQRG